MIARRTLYGKTTTQHTGDDGEAIWIIKFDNDNGDNNEEVPEMELEILQCQYKNATDNNSGEGSNLLATSEEKMEKKYQHR